MLLEVTKADPEGGFHPDVWQGNFRLKDFDFKIEITVFDSVPSECSSVALLSGNLIFDVFL